MEILLLVLVGTLFVTVIWWIVTMNRLVGLRNLIRESWANVDVALKRRYDLIPNLVETVKGFAQHERQTLEQVTAAREKAMRSLGPIAEQARDEEELVLAVNRLFAKIEAYPDLKASVHFLALQEELASTEDRIAAARRFFNANVRDYNTMIEAFPSSIVAGSQGHKPESFFEIDDLAVRHPVSVAQHSASS
jgi:LemA protein